MRKAMFRLFAAGVMLAAAKVSETPVTAQDLSCSYFHGYCEGRGGQWEYTSPYFGMSHYYCCFGEPETGYCPSVYCSE